MLRSSSRSVTYVTSSSVGGRDYNRVTTQLPAGQRTRVLVWLSVVFKQHRFLLYRRGVFGRLFDLCLSARLQALELSSTKSWYRNTFVGKVGNAARTLTSAKTTGCCNGPNYQRSFDGLRTILRRQLNQLCAIQALLWPKTATTAFSPRRMINGHDVWFVCDPRLTRAGISRTRCKSPKAG